MSGLSDTKTGRRRSREESHTKPDAQAPGAVGNPEAKTGPAGLAQGGWGRPV